MMGGGGGPQRGLDFPGNQPQFRNGPYGQPPMNHQFDGPPPQMQRQVTDYQQSQQYKLLPPPKIHGGIRQEPVSYDRSNSVADFGRRRPPPGDILVPTKVVDYQHRSAVAKEEPLDYFHRKDQADPKPMPRMEFDPKGRNVFNSRWGTPKRTSRFSDEVDVDTKRARPQERAVRPARNSRDYNHRNEERDTAGKKEEKAKPTTVVDVTKATPAVAEKPVNKAAEDYLEGISDEEIE